MSTVGIRGLAVAVALGVATGPLPARASAMSVGPGSTPDADRAPAVVLGLEASEPLQGTALTQALRRAFAKRGLSGGEEANLTELRLALGCGSDDESCLARGGDMLGARRLIYGSLQPDGAGGWTLELTMLETESGDASAITVALVADDLAGRAIDATAERIADELAPDVAATQVEPSVLSAASGRGASNPDSAAERKSAWTFGLERPTPTWKWVGFGVSLSTAVVATAGAIGTGIYLNGEGGFRGELLDEAEASLDDSNSLNDVDPDLPEGIDLCEFARERPVDPDTGMALGQPGQVRNTSVVEVCNRGDDVRRAQLGLAVVAGVAAVSTLVFTGLLLIHRKRDATRSAWHRHRMQVGVEPGRGGVGVRLGGRF